MCVFGGVFMWILDMDFRSRRMGLKVFPDLLDYDLGQFT